MSDLPNGVMVLYPGHRYSIPNLYGEGEQVFQFLQRPPLHDPVPGILLQDLFRISIDRLEVLDREQPWAGNADSINDLKVLIARQEARALIEAVKKRKLVDVNLLRTGPTGHLDWEALF